LNEKGFGQSESTLLRKNGTILDVLILGRALDVNDPSQGLIIALMDITERKQLEREYVRMMEMKLETERQRSEVSTIVANSARIAAIGVIAGGITHEINQPLNAIRIASDGILSWDKQNDLVLPSQISKLIQRISDAAIRIDSIIKHMRSFWIDPAQQSLEVLDLNELIDKALSISEQRIQAHQIELIKEYSTERPLVNANEVQLEIVVSNLILNAVNFLDFVNQPQKTIKISTYNFGTECYLEVADNGPGLPDIDPKQLFDPFYSTRQNSGGTGLGLAIVKMFADRFNATVSAFNNENSGATFRLVFPALASSNNNVE
jgi:signal transduction histidine kinase